MTFLLPKPINHRRGWIAIVPLRATAAGIYSWVATAVGTQPVHTVSTSRIPPTIPFVLVGTPYGSAGGSYSYVGTATGAAAVAGLSSRFSMTFPFIFGTPPQAGTAAGTYGYVGSVLGGATATSEIPMLIPSVIDTGP